MGTVPLVYRLGMIKGSDKKQEAPGESTNSSRKTIITVLEQNLLKVILYSTDVCKKDIGF